MTYALTRKEQGLLDPAIRLGRPGIRSMFRVFATKPDMTESAWQSLIRPMIGLRRAQIESRPREARLAEAHRLVADCVLGLVALSNARMPGMTSIIPSLGIVLAAPLNPFASPFGGELLLVVGSDDAMPHASYLAEKLGAGLSAFDLPVTVGTVTSGAFDGHVGDGSRWQLIWGMPTAVRWE